MCLFTYNNLAFKEFNKLRRIICEKKIYYLLINLSTCSYEINGKYNKIFLNNINDNELDIVKFINIDFHLTYIFPLLATIMLDMM